MTTIKLLLFLLCIISKAAAQSKSPKELIESNPLVFKQENLFIHFDKNSYLPGDEIWLKAYVNRDFLPSYTTTGIKIELIDKAGKVIIEKIFPVLSGTANGNISLPHALPAGNYLIRAYTRWMMQFSASDFYYKNIVVGLPSNKDVEIVPELHFFPEGGHLVNNTDNLVALTCTNAIGQLLAFSQAGVTSSDGDTVVTNIANSYMGLGKFAITPQQGKSYTAYCVVDGKTVTTALPKAVSNGVSVMITPHAKGKYFTITAVNEKPVLVLGHIGSEIVFTAAFPQSTSTFEGLIPAINLPTGILTIAVFDANNKLLAQRQSFINNNDKFITAVIKTDTLKISPRAKNIFTVSMPDSLEGIFSISVTDADKTSQNDKITEELLVYSKLANNHTTIRGLLSGSKAEVDAKTDLVLLTSKPKLYNWSSLTEHLPEVQNITDSYITLIGNVTTDGKKTIPDADVNIIVQAKDSSINYMDVKADNNGKFALDGLLFEDTATFFYQGNGKKMKEKNIKIATTSSSLSSMYNAPLQVQDWIARQPLMPQPTLTAAAKKSIEIDSSANMLANVTVRGYKKSPTQALDERYSHGMFTSTARSVIDLVNEPPVYKGGNVFQYLAGRYSYLRVSGNIPTYQVQYRNNMTLAGGAMYMDLYLDEMISDAATICTVPMSNIAMIKVFGSGFMGGSGALVVYTKKYEDGGTFNISNLNKVMVEGYAATNVFNVPEYGNNKETFIKTDNRTTLYWNPNLVVTEENKNIPIRFYNSDHCKKFRVVIQGFSSDGKFLYLEKIIE